jgi:hypothetical protein
MTLFGVYFARAKEDVTHDPTAVALATTTRAGFPSVRMVLLKAIDERGLVFSPTTTRAKATSYTKIRRAAMCFYWPRIEVQVRAEGAVESSRRRTRMRTLTVGPGSVRLGPGPRSRARRCHRESCCSTESQRWSLASTVSRFRARRAGAAFCWCRSEWSSGREIPVDCTIGWSTSKRTEPGRPRGCSRRRCELETSRSPARSRCYAPWHFLCFLPLPHGHGSLRPTLGSWRMNGWRDRNTLGSSSE